MPAPVPEAVRWVLWDLEVERLDAGVDADAILPRVLEHGGLAEVRWAVETYGLERIRAFFRTNPHPVIGERTRAFWRAFFRAEEERWAERVDWRPPNDESWSG